MDISRAKIVVDLTRCEAERDRLSFELAEWKMRMTALVGEDAPDMAGNRIISLRAEKEGLERGILAMGAANDALRAENQRMIDMAGEAIGTDPSLRTSACFEVLVQRCKYLEEQLRLATIDEANTGSELNDLQGAIEVVLDEAAWLLGSWPTNAEREKSVRKIVNTARVALGKAEI